MGKLGKKARKFAKKNLQSVHRQIRKTNASFKRKSSKKGGHDTAEKHEPKEAVVSIGSEIKIEEFEDTSLETIFAEDDSDIEADGSDSDGFLSEIEDSNEEEIVDDDKSEEYHAVSILSTNNREIHEELTVQRKKLEKLKKKDPGFSKFLESCSKDKLLQNDELYSDDDDEIQDEDASVIKKPKLLTTSLINYWSKTITEENNDPTLISLLNAYRSACHYGTKSSGDSMCSRIQNSETFCNILTFMLKEVDSIFRGLLKISPSTRKKETVLELKNTSKWKKMKPLIKSYLRSTLFFLNQVTDSEILTFALIRLRASIIFFAAFPSLLHRLVKITVQLWATSEGSLSSCSFLVIKDVADVFNSDWFEICLIKTYKAYMARCKVLEIVNVRQIEYLRHSVIELCSLDVNKSSSKAVVSIRQLAKILQQGLIAQKEESIKKMCSWEYANCIDLWVTFISVNICDYDLQSLCYMMIQLISGVANLFTGPRYFPLRLRCIQWLNNLSSSSGIFIPVTSFVLDLLEYKVGKEDSNPGKPIDFPSLLKLPKYWLRSQKFQEECVFSAVEMLSVHFSQWSYHISFPELATVPLTRLKKHYAATSVESLRRVVKRLIDQVEQNVEFVQKKRDDVAFSPKDHQAVETFLQLEKGQNTPFMQYYKSVMERISVRVQQRNDKLRSWVKESKRKRGQPQKKLVNGEVDDDKVEVGKADLKGKKRRVYKV